MGFTQLISRDKIDVITALLGVLAGIVISSLNLIYSNAYMITIGPMLIIVCLVYLVFRRKLLAPSLESQASYRFISVANIVYWASFGGSIYILTTATLHRPLIYFILISVAASMIAVQILYSKEKSSIYLILLKILLISLSLRSSAFWVFPFFPGVDPWEHAAIFESYINQGYIAETVPSISSYNYYFSMPIMHLNVAITNMVTGVDSKAAMFLGSGLVMMLSTVFVFLIGRKLINFKVGLLSALLLNISDYHLMWSIQIIAMSFGIALYTIILYLFIRDRGNRTISSTIMLLLFLVLLIFTHTVSSFIMAFFMLSFYVGSSIFRFLSRGENTLERSPMTSRLVALFLLGMLAHWMWVYLLPSTPQVSFFAGMVSWYYRSMSGAQLLLTRLPAAHLQFGWLGPILIISGYLLMSLFGVIGCLLWLSKKHITLVKFSLIVALLVQITLPFSFPLFGLGNIEPTRWFAFYYIILSIVASVAIIKVVGLISFRALRNIILVLIISGTSFFMITNDVSNMDSPIYGLQVNERLEYTEAEVQATVQVDDFYDGRIITDSRYAGIMSDFFQIKSEISEIMLDEEYPSSGLVLWRKILTERPARVPTSEGELRLELLGEAYPQKLAATHNLIYTNSDVQAFLAKSSP